MHIGCPPWDGEAERSFAIGVTMASGSGRHIYMLGAYQAPSKQHASPRLDRTSHLLPCSLSPPSLLRSLSFSSVPFFQHNGARSAGTAAAFYSVQVSVNCRLGSTDGSATLLALTPSACLTTVNRTEGRGSQSIAWIAHQLVLHCFKSPIKVLVQRPAGARNILESPGHCMQMANDWPSWPFLTD